MICRFHSALVLSFCLLGAVSAGAEERRPMIELGASGGALDLAGKRPQALALLKLHLDPKEKGGHGVGGMIAPEVYLEVGLTWKEQEAGNPFLDAEIYLFRARGDGDPDDTTSDKAFLWGFRGAGFTYQKSVAVNAVGVASMSVMGAWVDARIPVGAELQLQLKALVDFLGFSFANRAHKPGRVDNLSGWGPLVRLEAGLSSGARFRVRLLQKLATVVDGEGGSPCGDSVFSSCEGRGQFNEPDYEADGNAIYSRTTLQPEWRIGGNFHVFANASYEVFWMGYSSGDGAHQGSHADTALQVTGGIGAQF